MIVQAIQTFLILSLIAFVGVLIALAVEVKRDWNRLKKDI